MIGVEVDGQPRRERARYAPQTAVQVASCGTSAEANAADEHEKVEDHLSAPLSIVTRSAGATPACCAAILTTKAGIGR